MCIHHMTKAYEYLNFPSEWVKLPYGYSLFLEVKEHQCNVCWQISVNILHILLVSGIQEKTH